MVLEMKMLMKHGYSLFFSFSSSLRVALDMVSIYIEPLHVLHCVVTEGLGAYV